VAEYPTERMKTYGKAKELRFKIYRGPVEAHGKGELVVGGSGATHFAIPMGLGNMHFIAGESYGALLAANRDFSTQCMEVVEKAGYARDLCAYMRLYWGSVMLNKYLGADGTIYEPFPRYDFLFTYHICCDHVRWYRLISEMEGGIPFFGYDVAPGYHYTDMVTPWRTDYIYEQIAEAIPWMEKVTGRTFDDEKFSEAFRNEARTSKYYGEAMVLNQTIPAPLDERLIYVYQGLTSSRPFDKEVADFMVEFRDEVKDRVERGIAAVPNERYRVMTDSNPPWQGLQIFRHIANEYGAVSIGSIYSIGLHTAFDFDEQGTLIPTPVPHEVGVPMRNREELLRAYIDWKGKLMTGFVAFDQRKDGELAKRIFKQWNVKALLMHLNRGCWGMLSQKMMRLDMIEAGHPVVVYEGNMGDYREFDFDRAMEKINSFFDSQIGKVRKE